MFTFVLQFGITWTQPVGLNFTSVDLVRTSSFAVSASQLGPSALRPQAPPRKRRNTPASVPSSSVASSSRLRHAALLQQPPPKVLSNLSSEGGETGEMGKHPKDQKGKRCKPGDVGKYEGEGKLGAMKRTSGKHKAHKESNKMRKSTPHKEGVERKPLILKTEFSRTCLGELSRHCFNPETQRFITDGRWIMETRENGERLLFKSSLVSFD